MEFSLPLWFVSSLPIIVLLFLISYIKLSSKISALVSLILAATLAVAIFDVKPNQLAISAGKGAVLSLYVILIIIGAVILFNVVDIAGGFKSMKEYLGSLGGDKNLKILGLSWVFSAFIQGITGFGVPVAIVGGMLTGIGYKPVISLITVLIGHSWAISFGSMGSSFYALQLVTRLDAVKLGSTMAILFFIPIITTGIFTVYVYGGLAAVKKQLKHILPWGLAMGFTTLGAAYFGFPHIGSLLAGLVGSGLFLLTMLYRTEEKIRLEKRKMSLSYSILPYALLILSVLSTQIPAISELLPGWGLSFSFPGYTTGMGFQVSPEPNFSTIGVFSHPFFFLVFASAIGCWFYLRKSYLSKKDIESVFLRSYRKANSSVITVLLLMILASIMNDSGMISMFAQGMANFSHKLFPLISPVIGILGAFLTGSNTSSNVLFGAFQADAAAMINYSPYLIASCQSIGGSLGSAIAPAKIIMGTAIVGLEGAEGDIVKKCLGYTLISGLLVGFAVLLFANIY